MPTMTLDAPVMTEITRTARLAVRRDRRSARSGAAMCWCALGLGWFVQGIAVVKGRQASPDALSFFWIAQMTPFAVATTVGLRARSASVDRVAVVVIGVLPVVSRFLVDPRWLIDNDEQLHQRTLADLTSGAGLFAPNPVLKVSPYYPGLEGLTGFIMRLGALPTMLAVLVVIVACRACFVLSLYTVLRHFFPRGRVALMAVVVYASSPQFYGFNSMFAYETISIALGAGAFALLTKALVASGRQRIVLTCMATVVLGAVVVSHHISSWIVLVMLTVWTLAARPDERRVLAPALAAYALAVTAWTVVVGDLLVSYLGPIVANVGDEITAMLLGEETGKVLFDDGGGFITPMWQRCVLFGYAITVTLTSIAAAAFLLARALRRRSGRTVVAALAAGSVPVMFIGRLSPKAGEVGDRLSTFLFVGFAVVVALVAERFLIHGVTRIPGAGVRPAALVRRVIVLGAVCFLYLGGLLFGSGPDWSRLPGPYIASADYRSADVHNRGVVQWAGGHLPVGSRIVADRFNGVLLAGHTRLFTVYLPVRGLDPADLYFSKQWSPAQVRVLQGLRIRYVLVDTRLSQGPPHVGSYYHAGDQPTRAVISAAQLTKFDAVKDLREIHRDGPVVIYEWRDAARVDTVSGWVGHRDAAPVAGQLAFGALLAGAGLGVRRNTPIRAALHAAGFVGRLPLVLASGTLVGVATFALRILLTPLALVPPAAVVLLLLARGDGSRQRRRPLRGVTGREALLALTGCAFTVAGFALAHLSLLTVQPGG